MLKENRTSKDEELTPDDDIDIKMSVVGRKMTERITKKGIVYSFKHTFSP